MSDIKSRLIQLGAAIARGEYHPSHCVEDYRKGTGRRDFAALAGDCADRARGQVSVLTSARDHIADQDRKIEALEADVVRLRGKLDLLNERQRQEWARAENAESQRDKLAEALRGIERLAGLAANACDDYDGMGRDPVLGCSLARQAMDAARAAPAKLEEK